MSDEKKLPDEALDAVTGGVMELHGQRLTQREFAEQTKQRADQALQWVLDQRQAEQDANQP